MQSKKSKTPGTKKSIFSKIQSFQHSTVRVNETVTNLDLQNDSAVSHSRFPKKVF